jgi:exodeoxyribonuclease VIII
MKFKHVMVDTETLGTAADSVILSIGAVRFDLNSDAIDDAGFYASISIDSSLDYKRRIQEDTLQWWMKQSFETALCEFSDWLGDKKAHMWSNGADFDLPMLAHGYRQLAIDIPWLFRNSRCVRTYKNLPQALGISTPRLGTHHNALQDAIHQVKLVQAIQRVLNSKKATS